MHQDCNRDTIRCKFDKREALKPRLLLLYGRMLQQLDGRLYNSDVDSDNASRRAASCKPLATPGTVLQSQHECQRKAYLWLCACSEVVPLSSVS